MKLSRSGVTPQSSATFCTTLGGGPLALEHKSRDSRRGPDSRVRQTVFPCGRARGRTRGEGEEGLFAFAPGQSPSRILARQACGDRVDERTIRVQGQRGVSLLAASSTVPRPPMQISAINNPAAMLPGCLAPASISVSPKLAGAHTNFEFRRMPI